MSRKPFVISIMSRDRVGIVYEVSQAIKSLEGDIADVSQTVLRGYFTMILYASFPAGVTGEAIREAIARTNSDSTTLPEIGVKEVSQPEAAEAEVDPEYTYVLTASGQNRPGFVMTVSEFCVRNNINILDLATKVAHETYIMILQVDLGRCESIEVVQRRLANFSQEAGLTTALQHHDIFRATNEVSLR